MKTSILSITLLITSCFLFGQKTLLTTAERSNYDSTSTYEDVMTFVGELQKHSKYIRSETIATSIEGRKIPLMIIGNPLPTSANDLNDDERIVVYIQGNIHAGEVEGKEATQMLARDLLKNPNSDILKNVIVLINPILNPDGNEKFDSTNRTRQNGPEIVGVRHNGQMLDLNRDAMKLETPEISGLVTNVLNKWDPAILVDCHTTNGSYHEEPVTFVWQMNPNGDRSLINYMRDEMMPTVHRTLWDKYDVENIYYGEFIDRMDYSKGWISYAAEPRFLVNYIGLRNRLAILNENYVYADYKTRVLGCYKLLQSILDYASEHKTEIHELLETADQKSINRFKDMAVADSFAIKYQGKPTPEKITIKAIEADTIPGVRGYWRFKQSDRKVTITVPFIADYFPTKSVKMPYAYLLTTADPSIAALLKTHGIDVEQLAEQTQLVVEEFSISNIKANERLFQGHYFNTVEGDFITTEKEFPAGTYVIKTAQPLGNLAAYLLEAKSDDGMLKWNFFDRYLVPQWGGGYYPYPVYRLMNETSLPTN